MGKLIVIDGLDGSGKHTQRERLYDALTSNGIEAYKISFPDYESPGCIFVKEYLGGAFGENADDTSAYSASLFFGLDRFYSYRKGWKSLIEKEGVYILADRYTSANAVHQLSKLPEEEWDTFLTWLWDTEFEKLGLPLPDAVIYLELLPEISIDLIKKRSVIENRAMDIHERDSEHLFKSYKAAMYASEKLGWKRIRCYENGKIRSVEDISSEILDFVNSL